MSGKTALITGITGRWFLPRRIASREGVYRLWIGSHIATELGRNLINHLMGHENFHLLNGDSEVPIDNAVHQVKPMNSTILVLCRLYQNHGARQ